MEKCCNPKKNGKWVPAQCRECGCIGHSVKRITLEYLIKEEKISSIGHEQYFFCSTPNCSIVYFSKDGAPFYKTDLNVRVGIKESEEPIPVCYCFAYTKKMIMDDVAQNGRSTIEAKIRDAIKEGDCRCQITNPKGSCCLGNVSKIAKECKT